MDRGGLGLNRLSGLRSMRSPLGRARVSDSYKRYVPVELDPRSTGNVIRAHVYPTPAPSDTIERYRSVAFAFAV